jgi:hypothetical protein
MGQELKLWMNQYVLISQEQKLQGGLPSISLVKRKPEP